MRVFGLLSARLLLFACLASACAPIRFTSQDVILKHDQEHDVLDVLILYNEIESGGPGALCADVRETAFDPAHGAFDDAGTVRIDERGSPPLHP